MPAPNSGNDVLADVQTMYRRVLTSWVLDVAKLRRTGLHRPGRRRGQGSVMLLNQDRDVIAYRYPHDSASDVLAWRRRAA